MLVRIITVLYVIGILGLFWLNRQREERTSKALWIPVIWLGICASRPVSGWLQSGPTMESLQSQYLEGSPTDAAVWAVLLIAGLLVLLWRAKAAFEILRANFPLLLYFAYCGVSIVWADYPFVSLKRWIKAIGDVVMILVVLTDSSRLLAIKRLLVRVSFILIPVSVLLIKYYPDLGRSYNTWSWVPMYSGVTTGKNLLGMTCLVCGLSSLWVFLLEFESPKSKERTRRMIAHGVILIMTLWLFRTANSMTSLSCFLGAGLVMVFVRRAKPVPKPSRIHFAVAAVVLLAVFALFVDSSGVLVKKLGRDASLTGRTDVWSAVIANVSNMWFGAGFESYWMGDRLGRVWATIGEGAEGIQEAHNGYLEVYLNLGWIGLSLLAVVMLSSYRRIVSAFRSCSDVALLLLSYFVVSLIYSLTEAGFRMMAPVWIALLLAIITASPESWPAYSSAAAKVEEDGEAQLQPAPAWRARHARSTGGSLQSASVHRLRKGS